MRCLTALILCCSAVQAQEDEAKKRDAFAKEFKDKAPAKRVEAVGKMNGCTEDKSIAAIAKGLTDPALEVKKATAACLESCTDGGGSAVKPLCAILSSKKDDRDLRLACAKALAKEEYKAEAIDAMIQAISIDEKEKELYAFGAEVTKILSAFAGQDFGMAKDTPDKWKNWHKANQAKLTKDDADKLAAWKKTAGKGK
jgi:hypothetical protein